MTISHIISIRTRMEKCNSEGRKKQSYSYTEYYYVCHIWVRIYLFVALSVRICNLFGDA